MEGLLPPATAATAFASAVGESRLALWRDRIGFCFSSLFLLLDAVTSFLLAP